MTRGLLESDCLGFSPSSISQRLWDLRQVSYHAGPYFSCLWNEDNDSVHLRTSCGIKWKHLKECPEYDNPQYILTAANADRLNVQDPQWNFSVFLIVVDGFFHPNPWLSTSRINLVALEATRLLYNVLLYTLEPGKLAVPLYVHALHPKWTSLIHRYLNYLFPWPHFCKQRRIFQSLY